MGQITETQVGDIVWKNLFQGKLTYLHWNKGEQMVPTIAGEGGAVLVRKLPTVDPMCVSHLFFSSHSTQISYHLFCLQLKVF